MSGMHFEQMAGDYVTARPPYPDELYRALAEGGVIGPGRRVLEIGAGAGLATVELLRAGCEVVAVEPGARLAEQLRAVAPDAAVVQSGFEDAELPEAAFDAVVAATALHWVDLTIGLPKVHRALRTGGRLVVWRTVFGDDEVDTEFRRRVAAIVALRSSDEDRRREARPTVDELSEGGLFELESSEEWRWSVDLTADQVRRLFSTFSKWNEVEVAAAAQAADDLGGVVTEHYRTVLQLLRRRETGTTADEPRRVFDSSDRAGRHDA